MSKADAILELQEILSNWKMITEELDKDVIHLKEILEAEKFIPSTLGETITKHLELIAYNQNEFAAKYESINLCKPTDKYNELVSELEEAKQLLDTNNKYIEAIKFFMHLYSDEENTEKILQRRKESLDISNIEKLENHELQVLAEPYTWIQEAFWETDEKKKFSLMYKLASCFEEEIAMGIQFGTLILKEDDCKEETEIVIEGNEFGKSKVNSELENNDEIELQENNKIELESSNETDTKFNEKTEHLFIKEILDDLHVEMTSKAQTKFGVKEFKKDITKQLMGAKIDCMVEALDGCGYSVKSIVERKSHKTEDFNLATDKLYQLGYLKKYIVDGMGEFFTLSPRGEHAFETKDSLAFINQHLNFKIFMKKKEEHIDDTTNSAIVRLLSFETVLKQRRLIPDYIFKTRQQIFGTDYFMCGYSLHDKNSTIWFAGVITENSEELKEFKEIVTFKISKEDVLIVNSINSIHAKDVLEWLLQDIEIELKNIAYTVYGEQEILEFESDEKFIIENSSDKEDECKDREKKAEVNTEKTNDEIDSLTKDTYNLEEDQVEEEIDESEMELEELSSVIGDGKEEESSKNTVSTVQILTDEEKKSYISSFQKMIVSGKMYAASAYLKALASKYSYFEPYYRQLAYAINDPMENCTYSSDAIFNVFYGDTEPVSDYYIISATLRNYFYDQYSYDYAIHQLHSTLVNNKVLRNNQDLEKLLYELMKFKNEQHKGVDRYADYREKERGSWEKRLKEIRCEAKGYYENYGAGNVKESASHKRFIETTKLLLGADSELCEYLKIVINDDRDLLEVMQEYLASTYVKDQAVICEENIDPAKINDSLDYYWDIASQNMRSVKKTSNLMSSLRMNLYQKVRKVVAVLCNYVSIMNSSFISTEDSSSHAYKKIRIPVLNNINKSIEIILESVSKEIEENSGQIVLVHTLKELAQRLTGEYKEGRNKYYYIDFLKNDKVVLDDDFLPVLDEVLEIPEYSVLARIQMHCDEEETDFSERLKDIFNGGDDYGSAALILKYLEYTETALTDDEIERFNIEKAIVYPLRDLENKRNEFIEDIELAQSYGQIDNTVENSKETILQIMETWYLWAKETQNFGFFVKILEEFRNKIKIDAQHRACDLEKNLEVYLNKNSDWQDDDLISKAVDQIRERIEQQNYAAAEDLLNRVLTQDLELEISVQQEDYLAKFLDEYDVNYRKTANSGTTLKALMTTSKANKDIKGGNKLLENWPRGSGVGEVTLSTLLTVLGFNLETVRGEQPILGKIENYSVVLKRPQNGRKSNYKHPISAFGSEAEEKGFRVVCIFGKTDASRLIDIFKEVGNAKHTLVLLDYALSLADRRTLARKTKTDMSGKIFAVIDRVVLVYLAKHYAETAINRMLMSIIMPFASYQPYIDKSADVMPQEIFIGRKYELEKIESATGVNIVYGGRQLGKSALLKMAKKDIDHDENGDRAILVDIKGIDYKAAAEKISAALYDEGILKEEHITDDWSELARDIKKRLRDDEDPIPYLLLLIDEADVFIESCESVGYQPFDALKDIQSIGSGRFKFVVAGLRNIVRFKRESALGNNSVITHLDSLTVKPFKSMEARELLEVPLSYLGFRFPKDNETEVLISTIFGTTNYFPGLLQLYCTKLIEAMRRNYAGYSESETPPYIVKKDHIKKVLAEQSLQQDIREKFSITLKVGDDNYYYIIALLVAYHYHGNKSQNGCSAGELIELADSFLIGKIAALSIEQLTALMEEMCELNVLQHTGDGRYRFTRHSFCQMMGTIQQIDDELLNYMED